MPEPTDGPGEEPITDTEAEGAEAAPTADAARGRRRLLDPQGRRACSRRPSALPDLIRSGAPPEGREALYSTGPRRRGTVVACGGCKARSRSNLSDLGLRWLGGTVWVPGRRNGHWMRCPSCGRRTWCSVGWQD
ncbi:MAG: hypothetical protein U0P45_11335 [Acidimicrobiales bacterium]